jgi:hypothetical protein
MPISTISALLLVMLSCQAWAGAYPLAQKRIDELLNSLPGYWEGEAIETPVGAMDYDIFFHSCSDGRVAGVAETGASLHYWQFSRQEERLQLRFLSTFAGNRTPVRLLTAGPEGETLKFFAPEKEILTLGITLTPSRIDIHVFHREKPHVHIRLKRTSRPADDNRPHHTGSQSCKRLKVE